MQNPECPVVAPSLRSIVPVDFINTLLGYWIYDVITVSGSCVIFFPFLSEEPLGYVNAMQMCDHLRLTGRRKSHIPQRIKLVFLFPLAPYHLGQQHFLHIPCRGNQHHHCSGGCWEHPHPGHKRHRSSW